MHTLQRLFGGLRESVLGTPFNFYGYYATSTSVALVETDLSEVAKIALLHPSIRWNKKHGILEFDDPIQIKAKNKQ